MSERLELQIEQMQTYATMTELMRGMKIPDPAVVWVEPVVGKLASGDNVMCVYFPGDHELAGQQDKPADIMINPFANPAHKQKAPQKLIAASLLQAALADARNEPPRSLVLVGQNGQGKTNYRLNKAESEQVKSGIVRPITERYHRAYTSLTGHEAIGVVNGHSLGGELTNALVSDKDVQAEAAIITGAVRFKRRRMGSLMLAFAQSAPDFAKEVQESELPALADHFKIGKDGAPIISADMLLYLAQAYRTENIALGKWLASGDFFVTAEKALQTHPELLMYVQQGSCELESPAKLTGKGQDMTAMAQCISNSNGGRLVFEVSERDHSRADNVIYYARQMELAAQKLANLAA